MFICTNLHDDVDISVVHLNKWYCCSVIMGAISMATRLRSNFLCLDAHLSSICLMGLHRSNFRSNSHSPHPHLKGMWGWFVIAIATPPSEFSKEVAAECINLTTGSDLHKSFSKVSA